MITNPTKYELLNSLAERYIPEGVHKYLHVDSREMWISIMAGLIEKGFIKPKVSVIAKCAINWEVLLTIKLSTLN